MTNGMEEFYNSHYKHVLRFFKSKLGANHDDDAEDLTSEVLMKAWRNYDNFEGRASETNWINRIALNHFIDYARKNKKVKFNTSIHQVGIGNEEGTTYEESIPDYSQMPHQQVEKAEMKKKVQIAISGLKKHHKDVIQLFYIEGMGIEEISTRLDVAEGTVKSRLSRARTKLGTLLKDDVL